MVRDLVKPYRVNDDVRTRDFARWFWNEKSGRGAGLPEDRPGALVQRAVSGGSACRLSTCFTSGCSPSGIAGGDRSILIPRSIPRTGRFAWSLSITCPRESRHFDRWLAALEGSFQAEANRDLRRPAGHARRRLARRCLRRARVGSSRASRGHGPAACSEAGSGRRL